jgi:hypothetical protein
MKAIPGYVYLVYWVMSDNTYMYFWLWFNSATQWLKCQFSTCCPISGSVFIYLFIYVYIINFVVVDNS